MKGAASSPTRAMPRTMIERLLTAGALLSRGAAVALRAVLRAVSAISGLLPEQSGGSNQKDDSHDDEDDDAGGFRIEDLGEAFRQPQHITGDDGAKDRAHAADDHHGKDHDDDVGPHQRADLIDRRGHDARNTGKRRTQ